MIINIILRLTIWFLLTADLSLTNIVIGVSIALLLPNSKTEEKLKDWLKVLGKIIQAIPQAYMEAFEMIFRPHYREEITREKASSGKSPGLIFLEIFLITFTPKTIVLNYHPEGWYDVHKVTRRKRK
jgi:multicomponent Na+:H+ antiporter subunit E